MRAFIKSVLIGFPVLVALVAACAALVNWPWLAVVLVVLWLSWLTGGAIRDVRHSCDKPYCDGPDDRVYHRGG